MSGLRDLLDASIPHLAVFLLVVARVAGLMTIAPIFGSHVVPVRVRIAIAFFLAIVLVPVLPPGAAAPGVEPLSLLLAMAVETSIGALIGLVAQLLFAGVLLAGDLAGIEMGLGMAGLIDPQNQSRITPLAQWQNLTAMLVFLSVDGHHLLLRAVAESYRTLPVGTAALSRASLGMAVSSGAAVFVLGVKIAAPVLILVVMLNVAMGALAKLIPQLNVMVVGFPLNVAAGFFVLGLAQPFLLRILESSFSGLSGTLGGLLDAMG